MNQRAALRALAPPRRGLSRLEAATYIGIGATMFDVMVMDGRMPKPIQIGSRKVWDLQELDLAFERLRGMNAQRRDKNEWEEP